eukprot:s510_g19.t2
MSGQPSYKLVEVLPGASPHSSLEGSDDGPEPLIVIHKRDARACLVACLASFCGLFLILLGVVVFVGRNLVSLSAQGSVNAQRAQTTPAEFPRYNSCGGCEEGNKSDDDLRQCIHPCYNLSFVLSWERYNKDHEFRLVYFPSRAGPRGEVPVNISAWWLPAPPRGGKPAPRIVAMHGVGANCNHCGVQSTCYLLRSMGFSCLTPSARDAGLSGPSSHPDILSWGYDYHLDTLGGWDYAVEDPDGLLGGPLPADQVGIMGFSKGAYETAIALGLEQRIPGAWLDSGPYAGLFGMIVSTVAPYVGSFFGDILARGDVFDPLKLLSNCTAGEKKRQVLVAHGTLDDTVPTRYSAMAIEVLSGEPRCYEVRTYTPPAYCNGASHHQEMWEFPDDTRHKLCSFWSRTFDRDPALCGLGKLPSFQVWEPSDRLPPGSPHTPSFDQIGLQLPALRDLGRDGERGAGFHQDAHSYQSLAAPVAVVGAGFGGLSAARELQRRGIDFRIFEQQGALGGSWRSMANRTSKAQIERGTYHLGLADGECPAKLPNYTPRDAMLDHAQEFASHYRILDHCRLRAEVVQVDMEAPGSYNVRWQSPDGLRHQEGPFAAVMVYPGFLPKPRDEPLPEEGRFQGRIALGVADDLLDWGDWRHVLILGHGAFAVESTRTAAEAGAASVTMLCRRRNLVVPRVAAWLVDGSGPGAELGMDALLHISQPMYELVGLSAQRKEEALSRSILADPRGKVMSQSNPAISDVYFLLQALGVLEVVVGQLAELLPRSARLSMEEGGRSRTVDCSLVVKCLGWDHSAQDALNRGLQVQSLRGFWINGDPRRFVFKFASRTDGARSLATLSFFVQLQNAHDAFFHFLQRPEELEDVIGGLPTSPSLAEDLGSTFVGQTLLALGRGVPGLAVSQRNVAGMKAWRMQRVHPADRFLEELQEEWKQYQQRLRPGLPALQYPYSLQEVEHMLAERQQRSAAYEAARPADRPLAKARDRQTPVEISQQALETAILSATEAALGTATELSADTPLLDVGLDSLAQIDLRQALAKRLGNPASRLLSASLLFDYPTARSMATLLMGQLDEDVNATAAAATTVSTQATTGEPKSEESPADSSVRYQLKQRALPEAIVPLSDPARVLVPTSWSDGRPCRLLFLHGARCDAATTRSFLEATAWSTLKRREGAKVPLFEIGLVDAPHADVADPNLFESAVRAGWYDPEGVYRQWRLPNEAGDTGQWAESLSLISHVWRQSGPFDGVAGLCEGASAAALALLSGAMQPPPRLLISIGGYAAPAQLCSDLYRQTAGVPSFHFVGMEEESPAQAFPGLPCWDGAFKERMDIDGSHRLPELHGPAAAALRRFVALAQGEADHADSREERAELDPPEATFMDQRRLQSAILQAIARVRPASRTHLQAAASRLESRTQTADDEEFGNRSCFTSEFTFERCCQGAQAQVQSKPKPTDGPPCFHDEFSFTRCCASTGDLKVFLGDGGCFEPRGKYTYLKCCFELPDLEEWIHVNKVKGSPTSDHFQIFGTLYMTEPVKQRFRQRGIAMPPATLGGVSHADVQSPCLKSVLYDSTNFRYQLIPMWSGNEIFPPPPKEVTMLIKFPTRMKEAVACWSDAQCQLYMVKLDWYSVERHFFEGAYVLTLPFGCNLGEAAVTVIPVLADSRIFGPAILAGVSLQRIRAEDPCISPPRTPGVLAMCSIVCGLSLVPWMYLRCRRRTTSASGSDKASASPKVAIDILRLLATWVVVDQHRGQPFPFRWPLCYMTGADTERLQDMFIVLTVRLVSVHSLSVQSFSMKVLRKVAVQASVQIACTHVASFFVRPASLLSCGQKHLFDEQPRIAYTGWLQWILAAVTMRDFGNPDSHGIEMLWPVYPNDDFPNQTWPTSTWFVCLEYSIFWFLAAVTAIETAVPHLVPAGTLAYLAWMYMDPDHLPQVCGHRDYYRSFWYCRLPSALVVHCACRGIRRCCGPSGSLPGLRMPFVIAAIGFALALDTAIEGHPSWKDFGFGEHHCRRHLPYMVAGLPFQVFLLVFTFLDIKLPKPAAAWVRYLANLNFCVMASHLWVLMFFDKYAPEFVSAWARVRNDAEGQPFAMHQLFIVFVVAAVLHWFVAEPVQLLVQRLAKYSSLALTLAFAHPLLCLMTWPRNHSYYPLFAYGDNRSSVGPPRQ